jgi:hypothetical protein
MKSSFDYINVTNRQQLQKNKLSNKGNKKNLIIKIESTTNSYIKAEYETMERNTIKYSLYFNNLTKL